MKKLFTLLLATLLITQSVSATALAQTADNEQIQYFDDGSYMVTTISSVSSSNCYAPAIRAAVKTVTKTKTTKYFNAAHAVMWSIQVKGTFTYGNGAAKCTKAEAIAESYNDNWKLSNKSASKNRNKATASVTAQQTKYGIVYNTIHETVTLTCSPTGQFS